MRDSSDEFFDAKESFSEELKAEPFSAPADLRPLELKHSLNSNWRSLQVYASRPHDSLHPLKVLSAPLRHQVFPT
jgi:hypothetical protein